jgi:hypothetical protein
VASSCEHGKDFSFYKDENLSISFATFIDSDEGFYSRIETLVELRCEIYLRIYIDTNMQIYEMSSLWNNINTLQIYILKSKWT